MEPLNKSFIMGGDLCITTINTYGEPRIRIQKCKLVQDKREPAKNNFKTMWRSVAFSLPQLQEFLYHGPFFIDMLKSMKTRELFFPPLSLRFRTVVTFFLTGVYGKIVFRVFLISPVFIDFSISIKNGP